MREGQGSETKRAQGCFVTLKRAERLTGCEVRQLAASRIFVCFTAFENGVPVAKACGRTERAALRRLVSIIYRRNWFIVLRAYHWRCAHCGCPRPLEPHHKIYRSRGGTHRVENLEPVCWDCHRSIHSRPRNRQMGAA
jgi:hypothetical protein